MVPARRRITFAGRRRRALSVPAVLAVTAAVMTLLRNVEGIRENLILVDSRPVSRVLSTIYTVMMFARG